MELEAHAVAATPCCFQHHQPLAPLLPLAGEGGRRPDEGGAAGTRPMRLMAIRAVEGRLRAPPLARGAPSSALRAPSPRRGEGGMERSWMKEAAELRSMVPRRRRSMQLEAHAVAATPCCFQHHQPLAPLLPLAGEGGRRPDEGGAAGARPDGAVGNPRRRAAVAGAASRPGRPLIRPSGTFSPEGRRGHGEVLDEGNRRGGDRWGRGEAGIDAAADEL